jgi:hypothetical protein
MKAAFRNSLSLLFAIGLVALGALSETAAAQSRDLRVVSARAGGVNYVMGDVKFRRKGEDRWQTLAASNDLDSGDSVRTGQSGLVEVLLNPGSYLRMGTNSEFELTDATLDDLRVRLVRGSAVIEAMAYDGAGVLMTVETPRAPVAIVRSGIYRFDVLASGVTEVAVHKGRIHVGSGLAALVVKDGKVARVGQATEVVKLDKKQRDELDLWSRERGEELAEANRKITRRQASTLLASFRNNHFPYNSGGVWYFDVRRNCYTFLPYGGSWRSPYGSWYDSSLGWFGGWPSYNSGGRGYSSASGGGSGGGRHYGGGNSGGSHSGSNINAPASGARDTSRPMVTSSGSAGGGLKHSPSVAVDQRQ